MLCVDLYKKCNYILILHFLIFLQIVTIYYQAGCQVKIIRHVPRVQNVFNNMIVKVFDSKDVKIILLIVFRKKRKFDLALRMV